VVESFWSIPDTEHLRSPMGILREQATALTEQTKGTLVGIVESGRGQAGELHIQLELSVPALNDYRFRILQYTQPVEMYPGAIYYDSRGFSVPDEAAFISTVKDILSSSRVRNVLASLLSQALEA
jgi:hypothetical protein